jgi:hypothetical protein
MGRQKGRYDWLGTNQRPRPAEEREVGEGERGEPHEMPPSSPGPDLVADADRGAGAPAGVNADANTGTRDLARSLAGDGSAGRRRRRRKRDPSALRNDPDRKVVGAYVRKDVKHEVDRALMDERVAPGGSGSFSLLVDGLLERWLEEKWYPLGEGRRSDDTGEA